MKQTCI